MTLYDDHVVLDTTPEADFAHQLLLAWAAWTYGGGKLGTPSFARVMNLPTSELKGHRILTEEQLLSVDRAVAKLPPNMQKIIRIHYRSSEDEPMLSRYLRVGLSRLKYRIVLLNTQVSLYVLLRPAVDEWRHSVV